MNGHPSDLIGALVDGELKGLRRLRVVRHVRACPLCAAEYRNTRHVRRMLRRHGAVPAMSDSPEFFWSKVKAEIQRRGEERVTIELPKLGWADWFRQHELALASVAVAFVAALGVFWMLPARGPEPVSIVSTPTEKFARVERVSAPIPNTVATVLDAEKTGVTVIWVSGLPWTANMTEMKTRYANLDI